MNAEESSQNDSILAATPSTTSSEFDDDPLEERFEAFLDLVMKKKTEADEKNEFLEAKQILINHLDENMKKLENEITMLKQDLEKEKAKFAALENENADLQTTLENSVKTISTQKTKIGQLLTQIYHINQKREEEKSTWKKTISNFISTSEDLLKKVDNLDQAITDEQKKCKHLQCAINDLNNKIQSFEKEIIAKNEDLSKKRAEINVLEVRNFALNGKLQSAIRDKFEEKQNSDAENGRLKRIIANLKAEAVESKREYESDKQTLVHNKNDLVKQLKETKTEAENRIEFLEYQITKFREHLDDKTLIESNNNAAVKNVAAYHDINLNKYSNIPLHLDYLWFNEKIVVALSLSYDDIRFTWVADSKLLAMKYPCFLLLPVGDLLCISDNALEVSKLLKHVIRCNLKELYLTNQKLSYSEFIKLTSSKTLLIALFSCTTIMKADGETTMEQAKIRALLPSSCKVTFQ